VLWRLIAALALAGSLGPGAEAPTGPELSVSSGYPYGTIQISQSDDDKLHYAAHDSANEPIPVHVTTDTSAWTVSVSRPSGVAERTPAVLSVQVPGVVARVHALNTRGRLQIMNLRSDVEVRSESGYVSLRGVGSATVTAPSGEVDLEDIRGSLSLDTQSADVTVKNVGLDFSFSLGSGNLIAHGVTGAVQGKASTGNIRLVAPGGPVRIRSINGNTRIFCPKATVEIRDSSGVSEVIGPLAGADVETSTGRATLYVSNTRPQVIKAKTLSGAATVAFPDAADLEVMLDSFQKNIDLDPGLLTLARPSQEGRHVSVTEGNRGLRVFMESFGGRLELRLRPLPSCTGGDES
jgi:hypothetical protein